MFQPIMLKQLNSLDMFSCLGSLEWYYNTLPLTVCPCDNGEGLLIRQELNHQTVVLEVPGSIPGLTI